MELNNDLITQFAKITKFNNNNKGATTVRGTIRKSGDRNYIQLDGAEVDSKTPVETTVEVSDGDRVIATVKDHSVIVTGNKTDPSVGVKTADGLRSSITQTASEIRSEVENVTAGLSSSISQTAGQIRSEVNDKVNKLNSSITQTADAINTRIDNLGAVDGEEFTEFKQTVEGFYFIDENGTVYIDGGSIYAKNLELSGAITWSDLSSDVKNTINGVADDAQETADAAYELAEKAYNLADGNSVTLPTYIKSTYIDSTTIESPMIIGGQLYAVGSDPDYDSTFTTMDEHGFYLYSDAVIADVDNEVYPKISMVCSSSSDARPMFILGSGESDDYQYHNRFVIEKGTSYVDMLYIFNYSYTTTGFTFNRDGTIDVYGELRGIDGLFPIGYIYLSYDDSISPASLFGGSWARLNGYFLYAGGPTANMGDTGNVVTAGGTNTATYIKIAAWRRTA